MSDKVKKALEARKKRKKNDEESFKAKAKKSQDKIDSALKARESRIKNNLKTTVTDLEKEINTEIDAFKKLSDPSWGGGNKALKTSFESTRQNRINVGNLIRKVEAHRKYLGDDVADSLLESLNSMESGYNTHVQVSNIRSQFESEEKYKQWYATTEEGYQTNFENIDADKASQGWQNYLDDEEAAKNAPKDDLNNDGEDAWWEKLLGYLSDDGGGVVDTTLPTSGVTQTINDLRADESHRRPKDDWSEEQKNAFGQLYAQSPELAYDFAEETNKRNAKTKEEKELEKIAESSTSGFWAGVGNTAAAVVSSVFGMGDFLNDLALANAGRDIAPDGQISPFEYSQAVKSSIGEHLNDSIGTLDDDIPIFGGKGVGDIYGLGVSIAESLLSAYTLGPAGTLVSYFGQGAASGMDDALSRGATEGQAAIYGTALGLFEGIAESIGIDNLFKLGSSATIKGIIKNILKQTGAEGAEEGLTSLFSNIADNVIMQDKSKFNAVVKQYMAQGMSESEAKKKAWMNSVEEIAFDAIAGAASGGVSGSFHTSISKIIANNEARKMYGSGAELVTEAKEIGGEAGSLADKYQAKLDKGKSLSGGQINRLVEANKQALKTQDIVEMKSTIEAKLTELGESGDISRLADIIVKAQSGGRLTTSEMSLLKESKYGLKVSNELNSQNIENGKKETNANNTVDADAVESPQSNSFVPYSTEFIENVAKEFEAMGIPAEQARILAKGQLSAPTQDKSSPTEEKAEESKLEVSAEGKTIKIENGEIVSIKNIESISEDGEAKLNLDDGMVVKASDLSFGSKAEAIFVETIGAIKIGKKSINTKSANLLYMTAMSELEKNPNMTADEAMSLIKGLEESYVYGLYNLGRSKLTSRNADGSARLYAGELTQAQRKYAYELGTQDATSKAEADQKVIDDLKAKAEGKPFKKTLGKIVFEKGAENVDESALTDTQKANLDGIKLLAEISSVEFHVFRSDKNNGYKYTMVNGKVTTANGWFVAGTNQIWVDLNAGNVGEGTMIRTAAHEISHYIKQWSPQKWNAMAGFLMEEFAKNGVNTEAMLNRQIAKIKKRYNKNNMPSQAELLDMAHEELVSDALSDMLTDGSIVNFIAEVKAKDMSLAKKILNAIKSLLKKWGLIIDDYKGRNLDTAEAQALSQLEDTFKKLQELYQEAFMDANETVALVNDIANIDADSKSVSPMLSERTWTESEYVTEREKTAKAISSTLGVDIDTAYKYIDDINSVARLIADDRVRLDYDPNIDEDATVLKKNSEYKYSVDMSTLCAKRLLTTGTFDAIQRKLPNTVFTSEDIVALREMMLKRGYEVACGICYVESTRREMGRITQDFINSYIESQKTGKPITRINSSGQVVDLKKTKDEKSTTADKSTDKFYADKDYTPTLADLNTTDIDLVKKEHPLVYEAYLNFMNARGQAKPKLLETRAEYKGEILKHFKSSSAVKARNNAGGLRLQSFSDFEVPHLIDMMQIVMDMSRVGLKSQAYTKVPAFAEVFGNTGVKINLSLIAKGSGLDANGNLIFDDVEGINHEEAFKLRDKFSKNVGTILVGKTDAHIIAAMADPRIDYIIPFHKSSWKESLYEALGLTGYADYTDFQNEKPIDKDRKIKNFDPSEYWDFTKSGDENAQIYLEKCREDGRIPKFPQFQGYPGYWKLLIDFKMYDNDGVGSPQEVVNPTFEMDAAEKILNEYKGGHRNFPVAKDVVEDFVNDYVNNAKFSERDSKDFTSESRIPYTNRADQFSYKTLTSKPDMKVTTLDGKIPNNRADVVYQAKKNAASVGKTDKNGSVSVYVDDVGTDVVLATKGLSHGLRRISRVQADPNFFVTLKAGEIIKNSIKINEIIPSKENASGSYVLIGVAKNTNGDMYIVRSVVNHFNNELDSMDILYAINAKKEELAATKSPRFTAKPLSVTSSVISIADLLDYVNEYFPDVLPEDVLRHYKYMERPKGDFSESVLFSERDSEGNTLSKGQQEYFKDSKVRDDNGNLLAVYHGTNSDFNVFDVGLSFDSFGFHFGTQQAAKDVGGNIIKKYYLDIKSPLEIETDLGFWDAYGFTHYLREHQELLEDIKISEWDEMMEVWNDGDFDTDPDESYWNAEYGEVIRDALYNSKYDGVKYLNAAEDAGSYSYMAFYPEQIKLTSNTNPTTDPDIRYSDRDTSNRSILANALENVAQNDIERNKLAQYKEKIALIETEEKKLSEIQKKLFTKGGVEPENRKELQFEAKQIANRINTYDRQLLNLESTTALKNVLNREKALAMKRQKQKDAEAMKNYKEKVAKTQRQLLEKHQESRKKAIEGREKTAMRHKIKKVVSDLNNLLLKPTKERHVPEEMKIAVAEALDLVNMDTVDADTRVAHYNNLIAKAKDPDVITSLTETRDRIANQGNKLADKLSKLKEAYAMVRDSADDSLSSMYDDVIYSRIESVQKIVGKTPIRSMTLAQLESVYDLYTMVLTTVRDSNKAFAENITMSRLALGSNTFAEIKEGNKVRETIKHPSVEKFLWQNLKPMQAMKTIGSGTLQKLWNNVLYGQETFAVDYDEAVKFAQEMKDKYGYKKWNLNKLHSFKSKSGKTMKLNLEQMMSIYAYSKRPQADEHIAYGGIVLNEGIVKVKNKLGRTVEVKVNDSTAHRLDKNQVADIISTLEQVAPGSKEFVDEMQKYLSETMGAKGNEVSMKMYGIKLFKEEHYFPLKSSKDFMEAANAKLKGDVKIKNKGMTKSTVEHARNPIVLENFLDVWGNHINEMALYHGLVLPLEDFSRTLNYSFKADDKLNYDAESVRTALHDAFGDNADNYLNELLKAINGGVLHDSSAQFADKMISKFKKAKVMASLSVIVQQPTAIIRAMSIIDPKYFVSQNFKHKATWEELKKYCPTAIIKETGSFDTNMGRTIVDLIKDDRGFTDKVGDVLGKAPAYMDEVGWNMIWRALKKKVATEQKLSGEALLQECGKQMTLILNETQVYDSVMSRNELMRSKNEFTKMATAFMAEPSTVANMVYGAVLDFKRGKKGMATKTVAAVISSVVINGLVSAMVYALRDDDEEKTFLEKYFSAAISEVVDGFNPLTYIPYVKDVYSLFQGYKAERTDLALIKDVVDAIDSFYNVLDPEAYEEDMSQEEIAKHIYENAKPLLTSICDMFGLPVGNVLRDAEAIIVNDNVPISQTSSKGIGYALKEGALSTLPKIVSKIVGTDSKHDKLYDAIVDGDTAYIERLKSTYKDDKAYETAVRKALRENDPRIKEAAEARIDGDIAEYTRIVKAIKGEGNFSQDTIVASVNAEINAINKGESSTNDSATEDKASSIYKMDDYYASIVGGDEASAYAVKEDMINIDVENGKDRDEAEANFNSRFASYLREQYEDGYISEDEAKEMLVDYGDKSEEDATSKVQYWTFKQEYPNYDDLSEEAVDKYYKDVEPHGISIDVYYDYSKQRSKCKGVDANGDGKTDSGSKKAEILQVINSLPLTYSQKDALYYLNGWSAKTIYEAPWH